MANRVFKQEEIELMDESTILVRSLTLKRLREAMNLMQQLEGLDDVKDQDKMLDVTTRVCLLVVEQTNKELFENVEAKTSEEELAAKLDIIEDKVDPFTLRKIIEIGTGASAGDVDPNLPV